jgi:methyl coenzyme M reductase subunit C-like uncharacterized protein (methanogenesis marker protein 7)
MNVLFYISATGEINDRFREVAEITALKANTVVLRSIPELSDKLRRPDRDGPTVAVLLACNKRDLIELTSLRHLLSDTPLILILPDNRKDTTAMGHALSPRFLTCVDNNVNEVGAVLEKMLKNYEKDKLTGVFGFKRN